MRVRQGLTELIAAKVELADLISRDPMNSVLHTTLASLWVQIGLAVVAAGEAGGAGLAVVELAVVVQLEQQAGGVFCFVQAHAERAQTVICPLIYGGKLLIFASAHALCT
mgnify:CR=1 FL=1